MALNDMNGYLNTKGNAKLLFKRGLSLTGAIAINTIQMLFVMPVFLTVGVAINSLNSGLLATPIFILLVLTLSTFASLFISAEAFTIMLSVLNDSFTIMYIIWVLATITLIALYLVFEVLAIPSFVNHFKKLEDNAEFNQTGETQMALTIKKEFTQNVYLIDPDTKESFDYFPVTFKNIPHSDIKEMGDIEMEKLVEEALISVNTDVEAEIDGTVKTLNAGTKEAKDVLWNDTTIRNAIVAAYLFRTRAQYEHQGKAQSRGRKSR